MPLGGMVLRDRAVVLVRRWAFDFGWLNVLYLVVAFAIWFSIVVALVRFGRGVAYFRNISHDGMKNYATRLQERRPPCLALCCDTCMMPRTAA